jgi:hypothetical protein
MSKFLLTKLGLLTYLYPGIFVLTPSISSIIIEGRDESYLDSTSKTSLFLIVERLIKSFLYNGGKIIIYVKY